MRKQLRLETFVVLALVCGACSESARDVAPRNGSSGQDASNSSSMTADGGNSAGTLDSGITNSSDAQIADGGASTNTDAGNASGPAIVPGSHLTANGVSVFLGDTYSEVISKWGAGTRSTTMGNRSYQYDFGEEGEFTVWFANTGVDAEPADTIDNDDQVLWIAVSGPFTGKTGDELGKGSSKQDVVSVYGVSPRSTPTSMPAPGSISTYYKRGLIVGFDTTDKIRTITICKSYPVEPDGAMDLAQGTLTVEGTTLRGAFLGGTSESTVRATLGDPADAEGTRTISISRLKILSYAFIGFEMFLTNSGNLLFMTVHAPFYGKSAGMEALNMSRSDFESHLAMLDFRSGQVSTTSESVICYKHRQTEKFVGVSYSGMPETVSSITLAMPGVACE
ncbi:MAG: hypothetical protein VYC39_05620 [Myxococcota bacterium]|nr:hypothetical protein [Myxococcota bacterium]